MAEDHKPEDRHTCELQDRHHHGKTAIAGAGDGPVNRRRPLSCREVDQGDVDDEKNQVDEDVLKVRTRTPRPEC